MFAENLFFDSLFLDAISNLHFYFWTGLWLAGAPKIGDAAIWKERSAKGLDALVSGAINGVGAMPPRGGSQYDDDQIRAVIEYILAESK